MTAKYKIVLRPGLQCWDMGMGVKYWDGGEGIQRRVTKRIKRVKGLILEKLGLTTLLERRMRGDLTETFKIINEISNRHFFFNISLQTVSLLPSG